MELKKYRLGEIVDFNKETISRHDNLLEIKYLDTSNILDNVIYETPSMKLSEAPSRAQRKVKHLTIIYSTVRPRLKHHGILQMPPENLIVSTGFATLDIKDSYENMIDATYLYLLLTQSSVTEYLGNIADTAVSAYPSINPSDISSLSFIFPDITIQRKIASIWTSYDQEIHLNSVINDNLEAMAKQLYDYWFVQFDFPNEDGKPYKSSGGAMVWNEKLKREIPKGWSGVSLKDLALTSRNAITPVENEVYQHFSIPSFDAYGSYSLDNGSDIKSDKFVLQEGQLLVSKLNPWFNRVVWVPKGTNMIGSTEFVVLNPNNESESGYIYSVIKSPKFIAYCSQAAAGTSHSQRRVSPDILMAFKVVYEQGVVQKYGCLIEKIQKQQAELLSEIAMLTKQRDELLPLLMNGQASINSD